MKAETVALIVSLDDQVAALRKRLDSHEPEIAEAREHAEKSTGAGCCAVCAAWWRLIETLK